jgi:hypothetical protein
VKQVFAKWGLAAWFCCASALVHGEPAAAIDGVVEWDRMEIRATVSLDLTQAGIKLPSGRIQAEQMIESAYMRLIWPGILDLRADSSATVADLIARGEWSPAGAERFILGASAVPPAHSPDLGSLRSSYTLKLGSLSAALVRHERPAAIMRTLSPVAAPVYTGIVIIAPESLPVHGRQGAALPVPCLFPKIWDTDMNLIFERDMLAATDGPMVRYAAGEHIFNPGPSGLSPEIAALVGERPLRIFARGVFGVNPTDPIIDREDALLIISREENRRLLQEGKVLIILNDSVLTSPLSGQ